MFLDFEDYRPDTPRVSSAISRREGVLLSLLIHAVGVIAYLVMPEWLPAPMQPVPSEPQETVKFVSMIPRVEMQAMPKPNVDLSDLDRRASSPLPAPKPENPLPFSRGDTPERVVGAPVEKPAGPETPVPAPATTAAVPDIAAKVSTDAAPLPAKPAGGSLGESLRNLTQFVQNQNFENQRGSQQPDQNADIQFDSKGVEFGPWLRRFIAQVKRNWYVPQAAMTLRGRVVIQFYILKNGTITDIKVVRPSPIESFNLAALNSLKLSNPTQALPPEYPDDRAFFTVTFHYNEGIDR